MIKDQRPKLSSNKFLFYYKNIFPSWSARSKDYFYNICMFVATVVPTEKPYNSQNLQVFQPSSATDPLVHSLVQLVLKNI